MGPATSAQSFLPNGVALDASGNIYFADVLNAGIRMVTKSTGVITTLAGTGVTGYSGDGGQAILAEFNYTIGVALDASGNIYVADCDNQRIRKFSQYGTPTALSTTVVIIHLDDMNDISCD